MTLRKLGRHKKTGRKPLDGRNPKAVLRKLYEAYCMGMPDTEAVLYAKIGLSTLYKLEKIYPQIRKDKQLLRETPNMRARMSVVNNLGIIPVAQWYLARKKRDEFSEKVIQENTGIEALEAIESRLAQLVNRRQVKTLETRPRPLNYRSKSLPERRKTPKLIDSPIKERSEQSPV